MSKLTLLINWGYSVRIASWLPLTQTRLNDTTTITLEKPIHHTLCGRFIFVSEELYGKLQSESACDNQRLNPKALLESPSKPNSAKQS